MRRILIANRGDAALRVARAAADAGLDFVLVYAEDDRGGWMRRGDARPLKGRARTPISTSRRGSPSPARPAATRSIPAGVS